MKNLFYFSAICLFFLAAIIPNSLQFATAVFLVVCSVFALVLMKWTRSLVVILCIYCLSALTTVFYMLLGLSGGATVEAIAQTSVVYIVSPLLWILVCGALSECLSDDKAKSWIVLFSFLAILSVAIFFYLFINFGESAVSIFQQSPNIDMNGGYVGATMHVYGSLIFFTGGLFTSPSIVKGKFLRFCLLSCLVIVALTSGRSALILAIPVGVVVGMVFYPRQKATKVENFTLGLGWLHLFLFIIFGFVAILSFIHWSGIDLSLIFGVFLDKLSSGGGDARAEQFAALLEGILSSYGMGHGHGIGVSYLRNEEFPWRYELVWFATLLRVGILGGIIYIIPFVLYIYKVVSAWWRYELSEMEVFMFGGFICALLASNTNPYIEGFTFQWMYIFPVVHFLIFRPILSTSMVENNGSRL
ncbi:hypothetical protein [Noviherbaspirillum agri]